MRTLVATTDIASAAARTVRPEHMERIEAAPAEVLSANTRRAYASAWRAWSAWCASEGVEPLPAQSILVAAYLAERGEAGAGISTLRTVVAAIAHEHGSRGGPSPAVPRGAHRPSASTSVIATPTSTLSEPAERRCANGASAPPRRR